MTLKNRTKILYANAIRELMKSTPLQEIRVSELCRICETDRKTFYYHFKDKYDLVAWIFVDTVQSIVRKTNGVIGVEESILIFNKMKEDSSFYKNAYNDFSQNSLSWYIQKYNIELYNEMVKKVLKGKEISAELQFAIIFHCYACYGLSRDWILGNLIMDVEDLSNYIFENMPIKLREILF